MVPPRWRHVALHLKAFSGRYLSFREREEIALLKAQGVGFRQIARELGRAPSTISRELRRKRGQPRWEAGLPSLGRAVEGRARGAATEDGQACGQPAASPVRARTPGRTGPSARWDTGAGPHTGAWKGRGKPHRADRRWVQAWSPEQIANRLEVDFADDDSMRISHEAIYQSLYIEGRGAL